MARNTNFGAEHLPGPISILLKPILASLGLTFAALGILALCIAFGPVQETVADACILIASGISIFLAGLWAARRAMNRGFWVGMVAGIVYVLLSYIIGTLICGSFSPNGSLWKMLALGVFVGGVGGICGRNTKRKNIKMQRRQIV